MIWDYFVADGDTDEVPKALPLGSQLRIYRTAEGVDCPEGKWSPLDAFGGVVADISPTELEGCEYRTPKPAALQLATAVYRRGIQRPPTTFNPLILAAILQTLATLIPLIQQCWPTKHPAVAAKDAASRKVLTKLFYRPKLRRLVAKSGELSPEDVDDITEAFFKSAQVESLPFLRKVCAG